MPGAAPPASPPPSPPPDLVALTPAGQPFPPGVDFPPPSPPPGLDPPPPPDLVALTPAGAPFPPGATFSPPSPPDLIAQTPVGAPFPPGVEFPPPSPPDLIALTPLGKPFPPGIQLPPPSPPDVIALTPAGAPFPPGVTLPPPAIAEVTVTVTMDMPGVPPEAIDMTALASTFQDALNRVLREDDLVVRIKVAQTGSTVTYTITSVPTPGSDPEEALATIKADSLAVATNPVVLTQLVATGVDTTIAPIDTQQLIAAMKATANVSGRVAYADGYRPPDLVALTPVGKPFPPGVQLSPPGAGSLPTIGVWEQCGGKGGDCWDKGTCIDGFYPGGSRCCGCC